MTDAAASLMLVAFNSMTNAARTLAAALEHIPGAVFVVDGTGTVSIANAAGRRRVARDPGFVDRLSRASLGRDPELEVHALTCLGEPPRYLVIARCEDRTQALVTTAAARWGLTPRQRDVLACVARGYSNARASAELDISERTIEVHVTAILERARCVSRAELIAAVLLGA